MKPLHWQNAPAHWKIYIVLALGYQTGHSLHTKKAFNSFLVTKVILIFFKEKLNADHFLTLKSSQNILTDWEIVTTESINMLILKVVIPYSWELRLQQIQYLIYNLR